ncbi:MULTISPECIES: hypothetical protein [unclassified Halorubrum]|uniref:DUF7718 family protein n=1 Tax=unclassified Halorubrum TaxID=2642239 RepID=UPI0011C3CECA|nr:MULTISPECIES: hypothetical protein [unclassified Halorubrum]
MKYGRSRVNVEIGITDGSVDWFLVQLEQNIGEQYGERDWRQVARFDHHPDSAWGHDIESERLHLDLYRDGKKVDVQRGFPAVTAENAPAYCERFLTERADDLLERYGPQKG